MESISRDRADIQLVSQLIFSRESRLRSCEHILILGHGGVPSGRQFWQVPHSRRATSGTRSRPYRPGCHWQRALGRRQRCHSLAGSALSVSVGASSATIIESNTSADCGAGSRADSPDSRTLGYPSPSCSLLDFIDGPRCACATASNQPAHRGPSAAADVVAAPAACLTDS